MILNGQNISRDRINRTTAGPRSRQILQILIHTGLPLQCGGLGGIGGINWLARWLGTDKTLRPLLNMKPGEGLNVILFLGNFFLGAGIDSLAEVVRQTSFFTRLGSLL